jgi:glycosyltransferase involved in cell wall biosynthesis
MLSIIICTYNRDKYIYNALKSIAENDFPYDAYEIILINNNSTDNTEAEGLRFRTDFQCVDFRYFIEAEQGLSHARNRGITEARGDMLVFLDDDSFISSEYLRNLDENVRKYSDLSAFGGEITPLFESGVVPRWLSKWTYSWVSAINLGKDVQLFEGAKYPIGANMGISKKWIEKVGNFNIALGRSKKNLMSGEEKDIFNRIKKEGGKIFYFPNLKAKHVIPEARTTKEYIRKMAKGIGKSEKIRTLEISRCNYRKRLFSEIVKWMASILLCIGYILKFQPSKGIILLFFRWNVTKGLLSL